MSETNQSHELIQSHDEVVDAPRFQVELPEWSGPYDLLLQVIDEQKLDIFNLDISKLLEHYLIFLEGLKAIDLDDAGEFLVVAATLAQIKSKMLLPKEEQPEEEAEKDPREDLVRYLLEYQKIKKAAEALGERPLVGRDVFLKGYQEKFEGAELPGKGNLYQLIKSFQTVLREARSQPQMNIRRESVSVSERLKEILADLERETDLDFEETLKAENDKLFIIASFLAVLELVRLKQIQIFTLESGHIRIRRILGATLDGFVSEFDESGETAEEVPEGLIASGERGAEV